MERGQWMLGALATGIVALAVGCSDDITVTQTDRGTNCPADDGNGGGSSSSTSSSGQRGGGTTGPTSVHRSDIGDAVGSGSSLSNCTAPNDERVGVNYTQDGGSGSGVTSSGGGGASSGSNGNSASSSGSSGTSSGASTTSSGGGSSNGGTGGASSGGGSGGSGG